MIWPKLDPGGLDSKIDIYRQTVTSGTSGSEIGRALFLANVWASVDPVSGTDVIRGGQNVTELMLVLKIYYQPGILPNMTVNSDGDWYVIKSVENPGKRNIMLILNCVAISQAD